MAEKHTHEHMHEHGTDHAHGHQHSHTHTKEVLDRLARASGHLNKVRSMVENGEDCTEVLIQLAAVKSALNNTGKVILKDHVEHCLVDAVEENNMQAIEELNKAIDRFIK
ncbi:MAG: metal-sensing transcriptional repressor [Hespellia sp.]|nr:metal-sensing transcriptional repressor [Hespellia sp.]